MKPPPSIRTGKAGAVLTEGVFWVAAGGELSATAGVVVIRKSLRSLYRVLKPTTEILDEVVEMRSTPLNGLGRFGNMSLTNLAVCPAPGRVMDTGAAPIGVVPFNCVSSNTTVADEDELFAMATPL